MAVRKKSSQRPFGAILALIGLVGVAAIGYTLSRQPTVLTLDPSLPPMAATGVVKGSPDALVEIVEFGDFECPACGYFAALTEPDVMNRLVATGEVRFRFMDFPLDIHPNAVAAHNAAACANEQGKFWAMHDLLYGNQDRWNSQATRTPKKIFKQFAGTAGLDVGAWDSCYDSGRMLAQIQANRREGERRRVGSTPTFIIGAQVYPNVLTYDEIKGYVNIEKIRVLGTRSLETGKPAVAPPAKRP